MGLNKIIPTIFKVVREEKSKHNPDALPGIDFSGEDRKVIFEDIPIKLKFGYSYSGDAKGENYKGKVTGYILDKKAVIKLGDTLTTDTTTYKALSNSREGLMYAVVELERLS